MGDRKETEKGGAGEGDLPQILATPPQQATRLISQAPPQLPRPCPQQAPLLGCFSQSPAPYLDI